jgi:threonylcarbamoyladenosine tRNA methylthiotransferase MtaB
VGFPNETDEDFNATYRLIEQSPLTYLHVFPYSARPGTVAAGLSNPVPEHVSRFRAKTLRNLISQKNEAFRRRLIGREIEVLTLDDGTAVSTNFIRVKLPEGLAVNEWMRLRVTALDENGVQASRITTAHETS